MLLLAKVKMFLNIFKNIEMGCYSFSCDFPKRYANDCPESKILSLKYTYLQLLIQTSQLYTGSWHKLLKSKHCYFLTKFFPEWKFGDGDAAVIGVTMVYFCVRNFNV